MDDTTIQPSPLPSPVYNLTLYNKVTPIVLISLGLLYFSILLYRYLKWRYRKRKTKKIRMDRQKLERFWRKQTIYLETRVDNDQVQRPPLSYFAEQLPHSFESSATLVVSHADNMSHNSSENQIPIHPRLREEEIDDEKRQSFQQQQQKILRKKDEWVGKVTNRLDGNYQKKKRRQLLWQWSVAMGYCRYNHGHQLNTMINRLLESNNNPNNSSSDNL